VLADVCVMAYGQTGAGKTYTMQGGGGEAGLVQLAVDELLREAAAMRAEKALRGHSFEARATPRRSHPFTIARETSSHVHPAAFVRAIFWCTCSRSHVHAGACLRTCVLASLPLAIAGDLRGKPPRDLQ
jgi:hypothetical protein